MPLGVNTIRDNLSGAQATIMQDKGLGKLGATLSKGVGKMGGKIAIPLDVDVRQYNHDIKETTSKITYGQLSKFLTEELDFTIKSKKVEILDVARDEIVSGIADSVLEHVNSKKEGDPPRLHELVAKARQELEEKFVSKKDKAAREAGHLPPLPPRQEKPWNR